MPISKNCRHCNKHFTCKPSHASKVSYCSKNCMAIDYRLRLTGQANPNFKKASLHYCLVCEQEFQTYNKKSKYCSSACYNKTRPVKVKIKKAPRVKVEYVKRVRVCKPLLVMCCRQCEKSFSYRLNKHRPTRKYCSYACHLKSGGAFRAGIEASKMAIKYGPKRDANHKQIVQAFKDNNLPFLDLSSFGCGIPDGLSVIAGELRFVEIKNPKTAYGKRGLNPIQKKWISQCPGGGVYIIKTVEDVTAIARGDLSSIEYVKGLEG